MNDLIYREAALAALGERPTVYAGSTYGIGCRNQFDADRLAIETVPSVDAAPVVHGYWKKDPGVGSFWICSACGYPSEAFAANVLYKYCPRCGAKMEANDGSRKNTC